MADPHVEAARWRALIEVALADLPEIARVFDRDTVRTPGMVWTTIVSNSLGDDGTPKRGDEFWRRVLTLVELVEEAMHIIGDDPARSEDASELYAFSTSGILCEITRTPMTLQRLLPMMGPLSVDACREEADVHEASRGFNASAVDWSAAGLVFRRHQIDPTLILPTE